MAQLIVYLPRGHVSTVVDDDHQWGRRESLRVWLSENSAASWPGVFGIFVCPESMIALSDYRGGTFFRERLTEQEENSLQNDYEVSLTAGRVHEIFEPGEQNDD